MKVEQKTAAAIVGFLYLFTMATAVFAEMFVRSKLIVRGDALKTAANIIANEQLFRLGLLSDLMTTVGVVVLIWAIYIVLEPVNHSLALLAGVLRWVETAVSASSLVYSFIVLRILSGTAYFQVFSPEQLNVLARLFVGGQGFGTQIVFIFLGSGSAVSAYLWLKSGYIPRLLAYLGLLGSILLLVGGLATVVMPSFMNTLGLIYMMPLGVFEVSMGFLLMFKGLRQTKIIRQ